MSEPIASVSIDIYPEDVHAAVAYMLLDEGEGTGAPGDDEVVEYIERLSRTELIELARAQIIEDQQMERENSRDSYGSGSTWDFMVGEVDRKLNLGDRP